MFNFKTSLFNLQSLCSVFEHNGCRDSKADIESKGGTLDKCKLTSCCEEDGRDGLKGPEATTPTPGGTLRPSVGNPTTQSGGARYDNTASIIVTIASAMIMLVRLFHSN